MSNPDEQVKIEATVSRQLLDRLREFASKKGVSANTALQLVLEREMVLAEKEAKGGIVLVQDKSKSFSQFSFE